MARLEDEIVTLRDENEGFRIVLEMRNHVVKTRDGGGLTGAQYKKFEMVFHPDNSASKEDLASGLPASSGNSATFFATKPNCHRWMSGSSAPCIASCGRSGRTRSRKRRNAQTAGHPGTHDEGHPAQADRP